MSTRLQQFDICCNFLAIPHPYRKNSSQQATPLYPSARRSYGANYGLGPLQERMTLKASAGSWYEMRDYLDQTEVQDISELL